MGDPRYHDQLKLDHIKALADARSIIDQVHQENRTELTSEETASYDRADAAARDAWDALQRWEANDRREKAADEARARAGANRIIGSHADVDSRTEDPVAHWFAEGVRTRADSVLELSFTGNRLHAPGGKLAVETRALSEGTGAGSLVLPTIVASQYYSVLADVGAVWKLSPQVMSTPDGRPTKWPKVSTVGTATVTAEAGTLVQSDPGLGVTSTVPVKFANMTLLSNEILVDSAVDVSGLVMEQLGVSLAKGYTPSFVNGTGPSGTLSGNGYMAGGSIVLQGAGTITPMECIQLQSKINQRYRAANSMWATSDGVLSYLRQYRSSGTLATDGPWLIQMPSAPGFPETLFGAPLVVDSGISASGDAVREIAYGSFEKGYLIHEAGLRVESSYHAFWSQDQSAYRGIWRLDGAVQDTAAYGIYQRTS